MTNKVQVLLDLKVKHNYFENDNGLQALRFGPSVLNANSGINLRMTNDQLLLYNSRPSETPLSGPMLIPISIQDPMFWNYTDFNLNMEKDKLFYFDASQAENNVLSADKKILLALRPLKFAYPLTQEELQSLNQVALGPIGGEEQALPLPSNPQGTEYFFDLSEKGAGAYQVTFTFSDQPTKTERFFASNSLYQRPVPMIISWQPENQPSNPAVLTLSFLSRATYWRYLFIGLSEEDLGSASISPLLIDNQEIAFIRETEAVSLPNGQTAYAFHSEKPIALMERPSLKISLTSPKFPDGIQLPFAAPGSLKLLAKPLVAVSGYISEMYVYL